MAHKAGDTVTIQARLTNRVERTGTVRDTDRDGTLAVAFPDGSVDYYDAWELEAPADPITAPEPHPCCAGCAADKYAGEEYI